jgi:hypothetical protein
VFAGRDASKALGKSSMKQEDLSADYSELTEWELKVLDDWLAYYTKVRSKRSPVWHFGIPIFGIPLLRFQLCWFLRRAAPFRWDTFIDCL